MLFYTSTYLPTIQHRQYSYSTLQCISPISSGHKNLYHFFSILYVYLHFSVLLSPDKQTWPFFPVSYFRGHFLPSLFFLPPFFSILREKSNGHQSILFHSATSRSMAYFSRIITPERERVYLTAYIGKLHFIRIFIFSDGISQQKKTSIDRPEIKLIFRNEKCFLLKKAMEIS